MNFVINLLITMIAYVIYPFLKFKIFYKNEKYTEAQIKKTCIINSIVIAAIFLIIGVNFTENYQVNFVPALIWYYINYNIFNNVLAKKQTANDSAWQEHLEKNYRSSGTRTNMQEIKYKNPTTDNQINEEKNKKQHIKETKQNSINIKQIVFIFIISIACVALVALIIIINQKNSEIQILYNKIETLNLEKKEFKDEFKNDGYIYSKFNINYENYKIYKIEIDKIKIEYSLTSRKNQIYKYIDSLPLIKAQKLILYNRLGGYSIEDYKDFMFDYINNLNLSKNEKENIWAELY